MYVACYVDFCYSGNPWVINDRCYDICDQYATQIVLNAIQNNFYIDELEEPEIP